MRKLFILTIVTLLLGCSTQPSNLDNLLRQYQLPPVLTDGCGSGEFKFGQTGRVYTFKPKSEYNFTKEEKKACEKALIQKLVIQNTLLQQIYSDLLKLKGN